MNKKLEKWYKETSEEYPYLTKENFIRILLLYYGIDYESRHSFPDIFTRIETIFSIPDLSSIPLIVLLRPNSPFKLIDSGTTKHKVLLFENQYISEIYDYEQTVFDLRKKEPFYIFVKEINKDIVLKLNPVQLCNFFRPSCPNSPCSFCFRNDTVSRFTNISSKKLIKLILEEEKSKEKLKRVDEVSIITGSYDNDEKYLQEVISLVKALRKLIPEDCRIVVGSHEGKTKDAFKKLKRCGVTHFAFPVESFSNPIRLKNMRNRKGKISIDYILKNIVDAIDVFGEKQVVVRTIAGIGDPLDSEFRKKVKFITSLGKDGKGPIWNINIYLPFTHFHSVAFEKKPFFTLDYLFNYCSIINQYVPSNRFLRFKISA